MQKKSKRFLSLLLSVLMVISIIPMNVFAAGDGGDITYYVKSGVDGTIADGSQGAPFLAISDAIEAAKNADASALTVILLSDVGSTRSISIDCAFPVRITSGPEAVRTLAFTGSEAIGLQAGFLHIASQGAIVQFDNINLQGSTGAYDGRVIFVGNGAEVRVIDATISRGRVNVQNTDLGGAGILVAKGGKATLAGNTVVSDNVSIGSGAGAYVADGGRLYIQDEVNIHDNVSNKAGSGIFVARQNEDKTAGLFISGNVTITNNGSNGTDLAGGVYLADGSNAEVKGSITIDGNKIANLYLDENATLDMSGATKTSNIQVTTKTDAPLTPVSYADGYVIEPTVDGDEAGWTSESSDLDIRYLELGDKPGLYLVNKTVDMVFSDIDTYESIKYEYLNGEELDAKTTVVPGTLMTEDADDMADGHRGGNATTSLIPDSLPVASNGALKDLVIKLETDPDEYRMPTKDVISLTSGGNPVEFEYSANIAAGTGTITVKRDVVDALTDTLYLRLSAEKYHDLIISSQGALYSLVTSITGITVPAIDFSTETSDSTHLVYKASKDGEAVEGIQVVLYDADTHAEVETKVTDPAGTVEFVVTPGKSYYPILKYNDTYRVIKRDVADVSLSTLSGQTLLDEAVKNGQATLTYDASTRKANISNVTSDTTVTFGVNENVDTIYFHANIPEADTTTTHEFTSGGETKIMAADASVYGTLSTITLQGYDFDGWYTAPEGGVRIVSTTPYVTGVNTNLYAHWTARDDTRYTVKHWVEQVTGVNIDSTGATATGESKVVDGKTYYLYETTTNTATSDETKDITNDILPAMSDASGVYTWWEKAGFVTSVDSKDNNKVEADGNSIFNAYYDRKDITIHFINTGAGTSKPSPDEVLEDKIVKFGARISRMPEPELTGYTFTYWYVADENNKPVVPNQTLTPTDVMSFIDDVTLVAGWSANSATDWTIHVMTENIRTEVGGKVVPTGTFTEYKTIRTADRPELNMAGTTDTTLTIGIDRISDLSFEGFSYVGYNDENKYAEKTDNTTEFNIYVKPAGDGAVYLYYTRDTVKVYGIDGDGNQNYYGDLVYGGNFMGHMPPDPVQDGNEFSYWVDAQDSSAKRVTAGTSANSYVAVKKDVILYPVWNVRSYSVTYVAGRNIGDYSKTTFIPSSGKAEDFEMSPEVNGGYIDNTIVYYNSPMGAMPSARRPGYTFVGWYWDGNEGTTEKAYVPADTDHKVDSSTIVSADTIVIPNENKDLEKTKVLYAGYKPHEYTFLLNAGEDESGNPGVVGTTNVNFTFNEKVSGLPVPMLKGYTFVGWSLKRNEMQRVDNGDLWTSSYTDGAKIPLYAHYIHKAYKYSFDMNDRTGSTKGSLVDLSVIYGDQTYDKAMGEDAALGVVATRPGYTFKGWTTADDPDVVLDENTIVDVSEDVMLYAKWEPKVYNVKLRMRGASIADLTDNWNIDKGLYHPNAKYDEATDTWTVPVKFDSLILNDQGYNPTGKLPAGTKDKTTYIGYRLDGTSVNNFPGFEDKQDDFGFVKELPAYTDYVDEDGITLTIVMEPYFIFTNDVEGAKFTDTKLDIKPDGTTTILRSEVTKIPQMEKDGYKFVGWTNQAGKDRIESDTANNTLQNLKRYVFTLEELQNHEVSEPFYPIFSAIITFDSSEGGVVEGYATQGAAIATCDIPDGLKGIKAGYTFTKWIYLEGNDAPLEKVIRENKPVRLTAMYSPNITISAGLDNDVYPHPETVTMDYSDITYGEPLVEVISESKVVASLDTLKDLPTLSNHKGWKFLGWFDGQKHYTLAEMKNTITTPTLLEARWERIKAQITLVQVGGYGNIAIEDSYNVYEDVVLVPEMKDDRHFVRSLVVTGNVSKESVTITPNEKGEYIFEMPEGGVTINVVYAPWVGKYLNTADHSKRLVAGFPDKTFRPNADITRAEFSQILYNAIYNEIRNDVTPREFKDIQNPNYWAYKAITTLGGMGVIAGMPDGTFKPNNKITRAEAVTMMVRLLDNHEVSSDIVFKDVKGTEWYGAKVYKAAAMGWVSGIGNGKFAPNKHMTRAEAVTILCRMMEREPDMDYIRAHPETTSPYKDVAQNQWYTKYVIEASCPHDYQKTYDGTEYWQTNWWSDDIQEAKAAISFNRPYMGFNLK